jgi:hypothetical protein
VRVFPEFEFDPADLVGLPGHETPEAAAYGDVPRAFVKVVRVERSEDGSRARVLMEVNEARAWEEVFLVCFAGKWHALAGGGALGRAPVTDD